MGKPATASSTDIQKELLLDAKFAVDGGMQTRWAAKDTLAELVVELNPADKFNKISIFLLTVRVQLLYLLYLLFPKFISGISLYIISYF